MAPTKKGGVMKKLFGFAGSLVPALSLVAFLGTSAQAEISVMVDASAGVKKISPYLYGRNIV